MVAGTVQHHNHVLSALLVDHNQSRAGLMGVILQQRARVHTFMGIEVACHAPKGILAQLRNQCNISARAEGSYRLIGALSAGTRTK